ncbi:FAD-dependent monooxygenase [Myceligenerans halotolerans]
MVRPRPPGVCVGRDHRDLRTRHLEKPAPEPPARRRHTTSEDPRRRAPEPRGTGTPGVVAPGPLRTDVSVVGAGLTGVATASLLADAGVNVVVLDARTARTTTPAPPANCPSCRAPASHTSHDTATRCCATTSPLTSPASADSGASSPTWTSPSRTATT